MSTIVDAFFSDIDDQAPGEYYGGFKEARILTAGAGERRLSHPTTGDWTGSTFPLTIADTDRFFRELLVNPSYRYFLNEVQQIWMTDRPTRAALGTAYTVFVGQMTARMNAKLAVDVEINDIVSQTILSDEGQDPWKKIGDGFLDQLTSIDEHLDRDTPEPIGYGQHRRVLGSVPDPASAHGFEYTPILLGIEDVGGVPWYVWLAFGHAVADIPDAYVVDADGTHTSIIADEGTKWLIPHFGGHLAEFGAFYEDRRSSTFGNMRRYTLIRGKVGETEPDACASGEKTLTILFDGVEPTGEGTGAVITDRIQQYKHFLINYVANAGANSYQSGAWLDNPTWDLFEGPVEIVEEESFDACSAIAALRLPAVGSPLSEAGYIGAAIIGARSGERASVKRWIADWNRSCGVRFGVNHFGQLRVVMLHPTQAIKDAAPLYTDVNEILEESFQTDVQWPEQANRIPFQADYEHVTGVFKTTDTASDGDSIANYGRVVEGEIRSYPFAPGITASYHLALMELAVCKHPPRVVTLEATVGPDALGDSLGYRDLGDYIRYRHFDAVSQTFSEARLGMIVRHQVQAGSRRVLVDVLDCEDLIGFDDPPAATFTPETPNDTCANAIDLGDLSTVYDEIIDTSANATDVSVSGSPGFGGSGIAYHAAWFKFTGNIYDGVATFSTLDSEYDTQLVVYTGSCGALVQVGFNDTFGTLPQAALDVDIVGGTDYFILACGYGPADGGLLRFRAVFTPNP